MLFSSTQRALFALCLITLTACSTSTCRQWEIQEILTKSPCFNGGRLLLDADSDYSHLELEIIRNSSGIRFYLNLLFLQAPPLQEDPSRTCLIIQFENQEPWTVYPYLLEGNQRLLLPGDVSDILIQSLLNEECFTIQIGRSQITVIPDNFIKTYKRLLDLPIEECVETADCENQGPQ